MQGVKQSRDLEEPCVKKDEIRQQLRFPRREARGKTRWWWYGCAVEREEIVRELNFMQEAQIGGVELQILYPLEADDSERGIKNYEYLSPEFMEMIRFTADEAAARGMQFDLTLGSSWPFGGPFLSEELSGQTVLPFSMDVQGPCKYSKDLTTVIYGKIVGAVIGKMEGGEMIPDSIEDITARITDKYLFEWPWGLMLEEIYIPEGLHKIVLFVSSDKRQHVLKPLRGGEGVIVDHNRRESLRIFLEYAGDSIVEAVGRGKIDHFFCDSIEVFGHNWTDILFHEFQKRRGYELRPYIYALWGEIQGMTELVRYDFQKTMSELTVENFFRELTKWCHEKGSLSRLQAHGTWGDVLQAYGAADVPEGETFSAFDKYEVNTIHRRLAVSAGHVYHRPVISNESFTWLRFPRFIVTLEQIKAAADSIFLDGINQIVNHGYSYSRDDKEGMLAFYASVNISHTNTWWKYYKNISVYINRVSHFMQRGCAVVSTAIYLPQHDIWAEMPLADTHMCMKLDERLEAVCINAIHKAGYWFDYVNDEVLQNWKDYDYDTLVLIECDRIPADTMKCVEDFVKGGGKVIAAGRVPDRCCGLLNFQRDSAVVREIGKRLSESGDIVITEDKFQSLIAAIGKTKCPDVVIHRRPEIVGYVHRKAETDDIYFIANIDAKGHEETITFTGQKHNFCIFDPMDAREKEVQEVQVTEAGTTVKVRLEAYQSLLVVFSSGMEKPTFAADQIQEELADISSDWNLEVAEKAFEKKYGILSSWEKEAELSYYSGTGRYCKKLQITAEQWQSIETSDQVYLQFSNIGETAEIYINGIFADTLIKHPYKTDIKNLLQKGENKIEILVTNLLINRMIDPGYPEREMAGKVIGQWPYATGQLKQCRDERLFNWRERKMIKEPLPSGLWGEIKIICRRAKEVIRQGCE